MALFPSRPEGKSPPAGKEPARRAGGQGWTHAGPSCVDQLDYGTPGTGRARARLNNSPVIREGRRRHGEAVSP